MKEQYELLGKQSAIAIELLEEFAELYGTGWQRYLSEQCGVSDASISRWKSGERTPRPKAFKAIIKAIKELEK